MTTTSADRLRAVTGARGTGHLALATQPVIAARDRGAILFSEALLRLERSDGSLVPAHRFLPAAQAGGHGPAFDRAALAMGLDRLSADPALVLSVNVSPSTIGDPGWNALLADWLASHASSANRLVVEITESFCGTGEDAIAAFTRALRTTGIRVALDDFGTGSTAVRHLSIFALDIVKIDGRYGRGIAEIPENQSLVRSLIAICRRLSLIAVAEHVETANDADWLAGAGIDGMQGYLFGAPAPFRPFAGPH